MADPTPKPFTIEFTAQPGERFEQLRAAFDALKAAKAGDTFNDEDPTWLTYFDDHAKRYFLWSDTCVGKPEGDTWGPSRWYFWSMIHMIGVCDYEPVHCRMITQDRAELAFNPGGFPFGGTTSLRVLVECFGFAPVLDWDQMPFPTWAEIEDAHRQLGK